MNKFFYKVLKGAVVGGMYGIIARNFVLRGPKSYELDRIWMVRKYQNLYLGEALSCIL
jgi:hypothetical protein